MNPDLHPTIKKNLSFVSKEKEIIPGQHRLFKVKELGSTHIILEDLLTKETFPYKKLYLAIGEAVVMFVRSYTEGKIFMHYSVLNDYLEGESYDFDVINEDGDCLVIENLEHIHFKVPKTLGGDGQNKKIISLKVLNLDLKLNRLIFENPSPRSRSINTYLETLNINKLYVCKIIDASLDNYGRVWVKVSLNGFEFSIRGLGFQKSYTTGAEIFCRINKSGDGKLFLEQDRYAVIKELYAIKKSYPFQLTKKRYIDYNSVQIFTVRDSYGITHSLKIPDYLEDDIKHIEEGSDIELFVNEVNKDGSLHLFLNTSVQHGEFYTVEKLFSEVNSEEDIVEFFWTLEDELKKSKYHQKQDYANLFSLYNSRQNLWILAYLNFLENYIGKLSYNGELEKAEKYLRLYVSIENWLIYSSEFLYSFNPEKRLAILKKSTDQLAKAQTKLSALEIINRDEGESFYSKELGKLKKRISIDKLVFNVFIEIVLNLPSTSVAIDELLEIITILVERKFLQVDEIYSFYKLLEKRLTSALYDLEKSFDKQIVTSESKSLSQDLIDKEWWVVIKITAVQILLAREIENFDRKNAIIKSARMCRYVSMLSGQKDLAVMWLNLAVKFITNENVLNFSLAQVNQLEQELASIFKENSIYTPKCIHAGSKLFEDNGAIFSQDQGWSILSSAFRDFYQYNNELDLFPLACFFDNSVKVSSVIDEKINLSEDNDFEQYARSWNDYYRSGNTNNTVTHKAINDDSKFVPVRVKAFGKNNDDLIFCAPLEMGLKDGILHIKEFIGYFETGKGLNGIFKVGDIFNASVSSDEQGFQYSIKKQLYPVIRKEVELKQKGICKILKIRGYSVYCITDRGTLIKSKLTDESCEIQKGNFYWYEIISVEEKDNGRFNINAIFKSEANKEFDEKKAFRGFLKKNIFINDLENKQNLPEAVLFFKESIEEILVIIESLLYQYSSSLEKQLPLLYLGKLLGSVSRSHKSYFFDEVIKYYQTLHYTLLTNSSQSAGINHNINEQTLKSFPLLSNLQIVYDLLSHLNNANSFQDLLELRSSNSDEHVLKIIDLVLATHVYKREKIITTALGEEVKSHFAKHLSVHNLFKYSLFSQNELESELDEVDYYDNVGVLNELAINLGKEGKQREFKTSLFYFAGSSGVDEEKQKDVVMKTIAGFLNCSGGSLFLGVNDRGEVAGLENDYNICNYGFGSDAYERYVRKLIIDSFNKDVSGEIEMIFQESAGLEYLEVIVPAYARPVFYKNRYYHRQGNETRLIEGDDLAAMLFRRFENKESGASSYRITEQNRDSSALSLVNEVQGEAYGKSHDSISPKEKPIAYFYLFLNGSYMLSKIMLDDKTKVKAEIPILKSCQKGYLFFCYDNACVNKVKVSYLLGKSFRRVYKNGVFPGANLMALEIYKSEMLLTVKAMGEGDEFFKIINTSSISTHELPHLKGNAIIQADFSKILNYSFLDVSHSDRLSRIMYDSRQPIGKKVSNPYYAPELQYLKEIDKSSGGTGFNISAEKTDDYVSNKRKLEKEMVETEINEPENILITDYEKQMVESTRIIQPETEQDNLVEEEKKIRYLNYFEEGGYSLSLKPVLNAKNVIFLDEVYEAGFLYQFFEDATITKTPIEHLFQEQLDVVLSPKRNLQPKLLAYELTNEEMDVGVSFLLQNSSRAVKIFPTSRISNYPNPLKKGLKVAFYKTGLMFKLIPIHFSKHLDKLNFKNSAGFAELSCPEYADQINELKKIWPEIF